MIIADEVLDLLKRKRRLKLTASRHATKQATRDGIFARHRPLSCPRTTLAYETAKAGHESSHESKQGRDRSNGQGNAVRGLAGLIPTVTSMQAFEDAVSVQVRWQPIRVHDPAFPPWNGRHVIRFLADCSGCTVLVRER